MTILIWATICLVIGYGAWRYHGFVKRHSAAMNVVLAKLTYEILSASQRDEVDFKAHEILTRVMRRPPDAFRTETHKFGWYALAMAELGIPPAVEESKWSYVSNPWFAVFPGDPVFRLIRDYMKSKHGIEIEINN